ncbi:MAG TPA: hypothetical protein VFZ73_19895 [Gemmatimonadaceae bacterium]
MRHDRSTRISSLAEAARGDQLQVVEVLFDIVRRLCPTLGVQPGDVLQCEARTRRDIVLRLGNGTRITVDRFYASFVAVHKIGVHVKRTRASDRKRSPVCATR